MFQSHNLPEVSSSVDAGRMRMHRMMVQKEAHWRHVRRCREDGSCPEMSLHQSDGPAECIDGELGYDTKSDQYITTNSFLNLFSYSDHDLLNGFFQARLVLLRE